jgi:hypothetical protein
MFTKTHVMRLLLLIMIFGGFELQAQFSQTLKIKANSGKPVLSDILKSGVEYRITVTGEFSIWQEQLGNGVDAGYIYDVPQVLIVNDQWPAEEYIDNNTGEKYKGVVLPAWVGDSTTFPYNTFLRQQLPFYEFNFKKWTGFRVDNQPLLNTGYRKDDHQYQFTKIGTGAPVSFAIIDSVLVPPSEDPIPGYTNNSGELTVFIEEVLPFNVNICSTSPILDSTKKMKGIRVDVSVLVTDTNKATGKKNILFDKNQVAIYENGKFICPDTIYCNKTVEAISVALVFDRTNSMEFGNVSNNDTTVRINAAIPAVKSFVNNLGNKDKALLLSFSDTNDVTLDKNWTSDKKQLNEEIDNYRKRLSQSENVGQTALHKALKSAISRTDLNESRVKAIVVLSDGGDNVAPVNEQEVIDLLPKAGNIPIFIIALGMDTVLNTNLTDSGSIQFDREKVEDNIRGLSRMRNIANASKGRLFYVTEANALENIYALISKDIREEECCTIEYAVEDCEKNLADTVRTVMIYYPFEGGVTARATTYKTSCAKTFISKRDAIGEPYSKVLKVKTNKPNSIVPITLKSDNAVKINVIDNTGKTIKTIFEARLKKGTHAISIDAKELSAGTYKAQVFVKGKKLSQHEITIQE